MTRLCMNFTCGEWICPRKKRNIDLLLNRPFADAVRAGVGAVMCSYNQVCLTALQCDSYLHLADQQQLRLSEQLDPQLSAQERT